MPFCTISREPADRAAPGVPAAEGRLPEDFGLEADLLVDTPDGLRVIEAHVECVVHRRHMQRTRVAAVRLRGLRLLPYT